MNDNNKVAITNVRVFDGHAISNPTTVIIDGGLIGNNADGAEIIDGQNGILVPGLIDCHVHLQTERDLHKMAFWGVTTALSMGDWPPEKLRPLRGRVGLTDIRSPGVPATVPGSLHSKILPFLPDDLVLNKEDAASFVEKRISEGADYIKIIADVPGPDQATLEALVSAAHLHGRKVVAHAASFEPFAMAQAAKADIVTHVPKDKALDQEAVAKMVEDGRVAVPTLAMAEAQTKPPSWGAIFRLLLRPSVIYTIIQAKRRSQGDAKYDNGRDSVTAMHRAGVRVLAGTDAHTEPTSPFEVLQGEALHRELELLVDAGMTTVEALRAATSVAAKCFELEDRGSIEIGKRADLVLLSANPLDNISATRSIRQVWCGGVAQRSSEY
ncbi:putative hydrolase [Mariannaea sp. PMI_226]|nr:putative hydrolase [Mariannaea sp. PMI_226]